MQTFNVTFPQETRVNVLFGLCFSVFAICIVGVIWDFNHTNAIGLYFLTAGLLSSIAPLAAVITFKNYFTLFRTIELYADRILIPGYKIDKILFKDVSDYRYGRGSRGTGISIALIDGRKFFLNSSAIMKENLYFIEALNKEIEQLILSGDISLAKKTYAPFFESKAMLAALVCYSAFIFISFISRTGSVLLSLITLSSCFIAFIAWIIYFAVKLRNATSNWYQRKELS